MNVIKKYTDDQLTANYNDFISKLKVIFKGDRLDSLLHLYSEPVLGINLMLSPSATAPHFGNAYEGGYIDYINLVSKLCLSKLNVLNEHSTTKLAISAEELLFVSINHGVGKLGVSEQMLYTPNDSDWHIQNKNEYFKTNSDIEWMKTSDRSLFLLQYYGVQMSQHEFLAIMLQDGLYNRHNEDYLFRYTPNSMIRSDLPNILHQSIQEAFYIQRTI